MHQICWRLHRNDSYLIASGNNKWIARHPWQMREIRRRGKSPGWDHAGVAMLCGLGLHGSAPANERQRQRKKE